MKKNIHKALHLLGRVYQNTIFRKKIILTIFINCTLIGCV